MDGQDSTSEIDSILFSKYLSGEAKPAEVMLLEDWISRSDANKLLFEQFMSTWIGFQPGSPYQLPDRTAAWSQLNNQIAKPGKNTGLRNLYNRYSVAAVFAGIAILGIIAVVMFNRRDGLNSGSKISFASISEIRQNQLPDGSSVVLNSNSKLSYPEKFKTSRREAVLEGEGYFTIKPNPKQPFFIHFEDVDIQVLGTSFNVRKNNETGTIETQVRSGKVKMFNATGEVMILAGQTGIYKKQSNSFLLQDTLDINRFSYATKTFVFSDESLRNIIRYLEKAYSKKIILENDLLGNCKMTSSFDNKPIEYILDVIATTLDITYKIKGNTIFIGGADHEGC